MHASAAQLPPCIQRTDLFNIRDHPAILEHDVDAELSHNAIPLRRIYALNNGNKADDIPRSRHSVRYPAGRIQLSGGHSDRGDYGFDMANPRGKPLLAAERELVAPGSKRPGPGWGIFIRTC
ncbi:hypothetical protein [Mesorhizobium sp.]|uniref:hypothetical protein n=1 Tax=Mesorhizobium sp. TaxID=1871066 RepID=UPI0025FCA15D|nr:hypothetical protein [Mesorhizobium sp.]